jgi:tetratricopeptide (TPR) repeat protein
VSHRTEALDLVKRRRALGSALVAVLVPEPNNRHDPSAVAVYLEGLHIGFLHAPVSRRVQAALIEFQNRTGRLVAAPGTIIDHYSAPSVILSLEPAPLGLEPDAFENLPEMDAVLCGMLSRLDVPPPVMAGHDESSRTALEKTKQRLHRVDEDYGRSSQAWSRLERDFRALADRLVSAGDVMAGEALLGVAHALRYQAGRRDDTLSVFIESLFYDRTREETWSELIDYLSMEPHPGTLVELVRRCPFESRRPLLEQLLRTADGRDRNGRMRPADGAKLRRELIDLCERQGDSASLALLAGQQGLRVAQAGSLEEAVALWRKSIKAGGADPRVADRLSTWLVQRGHYQEAAEALSAALAEANVSEAQRDRMQKRLDRCRRAVRDVAPTPKWVTSPDTAAGGPAGREPPA